MYTHLNPINLQNRAMNIFISLSIHLFLLITTIRHYSSLFVTVRDFSHYSVAIRVFSLANRSSFERDNDVFVFGLYIFTPKEFTNMGQQNFLISEQSLRPLYEKKIFSMKGAFCDQEGQVFNSNTEFLNMDGTCHLKF